eukprot:Nk52_evm70s62 gene=Nk52_evmTU70s62
MDYAGIDDDLHNALLSVASPMKRAMAEEDLVGADTDEYPLSSELFSQKARKQSKYVKEIDEDRMVYLNAIQAMKEEIDELERQLEENANKENESNTQTDMEEIMNFLLESSDERFQKKLLATSEAEQEAEESSNMATENNKLATLAMFTGLHFENFKCTHYTEGQEPRDPQHCGRILFIEGNTSKINFSLEFLIPEKSMRIKSLAIMIPDLKTSLELRTFISTCEKHCALHSFMKGIVNYGAMNLRRERLFKQVKRKFRQGVVVPQGPRGSQFIIMQHPSRKGISFIFSWKIDIAETGILTPVLDLVPRIAGHADIKLFESAIQQMPEIFNKMMSIRTIESTVHILAHLVSSQHT